MIAFEDYRSRYPHVALSREDGILRMRLHTAERSLVWADPVHDELVDAFGAITADQRNRVVILTGTGGSFISPPARRGPALPGGWGGQAARRSIMLAQLDIDVPMVAAVNGPVAARPDIVALCDVVVAASTVHFPPGAGRSEAMTLGEALRLGMISEVVEPDELEGRAWELALRLRSVPARTLRYLRGQFTADVRSRLAAVELDRCGSGDDAEIVELRRRDASD